MSRDIQWQNQLVFLHSFGGHKVICPIQASHLTFLYLPINIDIPQGHGENVIKMLINSNTLKKNCFWLNMAFYIGAIKLTTTRKGWVQ